MVATRSLVLVLALALAPACGDNDTDVVVVGDPVGDSIAEGQATGDNLADQTFGELNGDDYVVVIGKTASILAALNDGAIDQAQFALDFLVVDDIFQYANNEIADHDDSNIALDNV